ncbi:glycosyltransferase [Seonamhaeicola sp. ML3]|uniref:glycosyltransferase family 2 protein n=1 Tax=Seonamhaeicola sp. ML3 TaxID=2937786 RepID=UPI00200F9372|nr:glycosyltransferase [Seonamhaeicola sp. ML3]
MIAPKITVLMPVYNNESYINEAVDSILNQTFSDFQLLIIDDGSTDKSVALIKKYDDVRIKLVEKDNNTGLIDCLNLGLSLATGKYVARMDGDDISVADRFEKQLAILENDQDIKVCGCWLKTFGDKEEIIKHKEFHDEIVANMLIHCSMTMGAVMFERKAFEGYSFNKEKVHVEDYDFWSRIAWSCKFYNIQEILYLYRTHNTQVSAVYKEIQKQGDVAIKLFLFKKIKYNAKLYSDALITKMLLLNKELKLSEFSGFINWINELKQVNKNAKVYSQKDLESVLKIIKRKIFYKVYFSNSIKGITKKWRLKSIYKLDFNDALWVLNIKRRQIFKSLFQ